MKQFLALILAFLAFLKIEAQEINVTGTVKDEKNNPLAGATVIVKQTKATAATNDAGGFSIKSKKAMFWKFRLQVFTERNFCFRNRQFGYCSKSR